MKKILLSLLILVLSVFIAGCHKLIENPENFADWNIAREPNDTYKISDYISYEKVESWYIYTYTTKMFEDENVYYPMEFSLFSENLLDDSDITIEDEWGWRKVIIDIPHQKFIDAYVYWWQTHTISIWDNDLNDVLVYYCVSNELSGWPYLFNHWRIPWIDESCLFDMWMSERESLANAFWFEISSEIWSFWIRKLKSFDEQWEKCQQQLSNYNKPEYFVFWSIEPSNKNFACTVAYSWKPMNLISINVWERQRDNMLEAWIFHDVKWWIFTVSDWFHSYTFMDKNLWAEIAWTWEESYWCFFQRWNNHSFPWTWEIEKSNQRLQNPEKYWPENYLDNPVFITPQERNPQVRLRDYWEDEKHNDDLWWWAEESWLLIHEDDMSRQWPCPEWFHIPTYSELGGMFWAFNYYYRWIGDDPNNHSFENEVLIPFAGSRDFEYWWSWWQWEIRWLWSASPSVSNAWYSQTLYSSHSENDIPRWAAFPIRCFKD